MSQEIHIKFQFIGDPYHEWLNFDNIKEELITNPLVLEHSCSKTVVNKRTFLGKNPSTLCQTVYDWTFKAYTLEEGFAEKVDRLVKKIASDSKVVVIDYLVEGERKKIGYTDDKREEITSAHKDSRINAKLASIEGRLRNLEKNVNKIKSVGYNQHTRIGKLEGAPDEKIYRSPYNMVDGG